MYAPLPSRERPTCRRARPVARHGSSVVWVAHPSLKRRKKTTRKKAVRTWWTGAMQRTHKDEDVVLIDEETKRVRGKFLERLRSGHVNTGSELRAAASGCSSTTEYFCTDDDSSAESLLAHRQHFSSSDGLTLAPFGCTRRRSRGPDSHHWFACHDLFSRHVMSLMGDPA